MEIRFIKIGSRIINIGEVLAVINGRFPNPDNGYKLEDGVQVVLPTTEGGEDNFPHYAFSFEFFGDEAAAVWKFFAPGDPAGKRLGRTIDITPGPAAPTE